MKIQLDKIREIITTWEHDIRRTKVFERDSIQFLRKKLNSQVPDVLLGIRRSGKTYMMYTLFQENRDAMYINFEDERLADMDVTILDDIYRVYIALKAPERPLMFLDEIQNIKGWEKFVARMHEKVKFVISGSNASLLSSEFATALTGRYVPHYVYTLSFKEFVQTKGSMPEPYVTEGKAILESLFDDYLNWGGFPQASLQKNADLLKVYFESILFRDIIPRFSVQNVRGIETLARYMLSNPGKFFSYNRLKGIADVGHETTVKDYINHLEKAFLLHAITKYDHSIRKQMANLKKAYAADNGLVNHAGTLYTAESGRLLETIVFNELIRRGYDVYYWKDNKDREIDFVVCSGLSPVMLIQVTDSISNHKQFQRETLAMLEADQYFGTGKCLLITRGEITPEIPEGITHIQCFRWLLEV